MHDELLRSPDAREAMKVGVEMWNSEAVADPATPAAALGTLRVHGQQDAGGAGGGGTWMREHGAEAGFVRQLFKGTDLAVFRWLQPQWFVDVRDVAALHVAALVLEGLEGERGFGWAEPYTWTGVVKAVEKLYPGRAIAQLEDKG